MGIKIEFDAVGNPIQPTLVLAKRSGEKIGIITNVNSLTISDVFNDVPEMSFSVHKYDNGKIIPFWSEIKNLRLIWCKEWDVWFELSLSVEESSDTIKAVTCKRLAEAELSQVTLHNIEINSEDDLEANNKDTYTDDSGKTQYYNPDYENVYYPTTLYNEENHHWSLLHRITQDKANEYTIKFYDTKAIDINGNIKNTFLAEEQRNFSFDGTTVRDALNDIAQELDLYITYDSSTADDGTINRIIEVHDLDAICLNDDCSYYKEYDKKHRYRADFIGKCPICSSTNIRLGYGNDTTIFVDNQGLTDDISLTTNVDEIKDVFYLKSADDLMNATIRNSTPSGDSYIYYFSDEIKNDMSNELSTALDEYQKQYDYYNNNNDAIDLYSNTIINNNTSVNHNLEWYKTLYSDYNKLVNTYNNDFGKTHYSLSGSNTKEPYVLGTIDNSKMSYSAVMKLYYDVIDFVNYLQIDRLPSGDLDNLDVNAELTKLVAAFEQSTEITVPDFYNAKQIGVSSTNKSTVEAAILHVAKFIVDPRAKVEIITADQGIKIEEQSRTDTASGADHNEYTVKIGSWKGSITITANKDKTQAATKDNVTVNIYQVPVNVMSQEQSNLISKFLLQNIQDKITNKSDYSSFRSLFAMQSTYHYGTITTSTGTVSTGVIEKVDFNFALSSDEFEKRLNDYSLDALNSLYECCQACVDILQEQTSGGKSTWSRKSGNKPFMDTSEDTTLSAWEDGKKYSRDVRIYWGKTYYKSLYVNGYKPYVADRGARKPNVNLSIYLPTKCVLFFAGYFGAIQQTDTSQAGGLRGYGIGNGDLGDKTYIWCTDGTAGTIKIKTDECEITVYTGSTQINTELYQPYIIRLGLISDAVTKRENELVILRGDEDESGNYSEIGIKQVLSAIQKYVNNNVNLTKFFANKLAKTSDNEKTKIKRIIQELNSFRREDTWDNSNYSSEGLSNTELFQKAKEFLREANKNLVKAATPKQQISANLKDLLVIPEFKKIRKYFEVGNWIRIKVEDSIYKLRLMEYSVSFDDLSSIDTVFSNVEKVNGGFSDIQNVLSQATSISTNYNGIKKQANLGMQAYQKVQQFEAGGGINIDYTQLFSNTDNSGIQINSDGAVFYGSNGSNQIRISNGTMSYTNNNWQTSHSALGVVEYKIYSGDSFSIEQHYGTNIEYGDFTFLNSEQIVSENIYSDNYSTDVGTYLDLNNGNATFNGNITVNENANLNGGLSTSVITASDKITANNGIDVINNITSDNITVSGISELQGDVTVGGNLTVTGEKNRAVKTKHYGNRKLYSYETASPYFGDIGQGAISDNGLCQIDINEIFKDTIISEYIVFLQAIGENDIYLIEQNSNSFTVKGKPNTKFNYEIKGKQIDNPNVYLEET